MPLSDLQILKYLVEHFLLLAKNQKKFVEKVMPTFHRLVFLAGNLLVKHNYFLRDSLLTQQKSKKSKLIQTFLSWSTYNFANILEDFKKKVPRNILLKKYWWHNTCWIRFILITFLHALNITFQSTVMLRTLFSDTVLLISFSKRGKLLRKHIFILFEGQ